MVHITIMSGCLEETVKFYQDAFGMDIYRDMRDRKPAMAFLSDKKREISMELAENPKDSYEGRGLMIGFETGKDLDEFRKGLIEKGYHPGEIVSPDPAIRFFFIDDPNGLKVQVF